MTIDRLKTVSIERAGKLVGVDAKTIAAALAQFDKSHGARGLAYVILPGQKRQRIRLCAIDRWLCNCEEVSRRVGR